MTPGLLQTGAFLHIPMTSGVVTQAKAVGRVKGRGRCLRSSAIRFRSRLRGISETPLAAIAELTFAYGAHSVHFSADEPREFRSVEANGVSLWPRRYEFEAAARAALDSHGLHLVTWPEIQFIKHRNSTLRFPGTGSGAGCSSSTAWCRPCARAAGASRSTPHFRTSYRSRRLGRADRAKRKQLVRVRSRHQRRRRARIATADRHRRVARAWHSFARRTGAAR